MSVQMILLPLFVHVALVLAVLLRAVKSTEVTADGLRAIPEWPWLTGLAQRIEGGTAYTAQVGWQDGLPAFEVHSDLQGLGLPWPAPLHKAATDRLPLHVTQKVTQRQSDGRPLRELPAFPAGGLPSWEASQGRQATRAGVAGKHRHPCSGMSSSTTIQIRKRDRKTTHTEQCRPSPLACRAHHQSFHRH